MPIPSHVFLYFDLVLDKGLLVGRLGGRAALVLVVVAEVEEIVDEGGIWLDDPPAGHGARFLLKDLGPARLDR